MRMNQFSPPTRGWPARPRPDGSTPRVFPAHAGMAQSVWHASANRSAFSPPTRGWPAECERLSHWCLVFPAHAGMARTARGEP